MNLSIEDYLLLATSGIGVLSGVWGYISHRTKSELQEYLAVKFILGSVVIGIASTFVLGARYSIRRALLHFVLYYMLIFLGLAVYHKLDRKQQ